MATLAHNFGGDLSLSAGGDLLMADGTTATTQRLLRRLLTNAGDYLWNLGYGAGLSAQIGQPSSVLAVQSTIRSQIFADPGVAKVPEPTVTLTKTDAGVFTVNIIYTDAATGQSVPLSLPLG